MSRHPPKLTDPPLRTTLGSTLSALNPILPQEHRHKHVPSRPPISPVRSDRSSILCFYSGRPRHSFLIFHRTEVKVVTANNVYGHICAGTAAFNAAARQILAGR